MPSLPTTWIIIAVLIASLTGAGWYAKHQTEGRAAAEAANAGIKAQADADIKTAQDAAGAWQAALAQQTAYARELDAKLATSAAGYDQLRRTTDKRIASYAQQTRSDAVTRDWNDMPAPDSVAARMCSYTDTPAVNGAGADRVPQGAAAVHRPAQDACAGAFSTGDLFRWTEQLIEVIDRANQDRAAIR